MSCMDIVHLNSQIFFEQFHIHFKTHGGSRGDNVQSSSARIAHCTPLGGCLIVNIACFS